MQIETTLAGTAYNGRKNNLRNIPPGVWLAIVPEPENPNDKNALCLYFDEKEVGYIPAQYAKKYRDKIQAVLLHENEMITLLIED